MDLEEKGAMTEPEQASPLRVFPNPGCGGGINEGEFVQACMTQKGVQM
jgi:hypothetical protein